MIDGLGLPQSILVLGGTSDIGLAIVDRLVVARTTTVVLAGRDPERLARAAARVRAAGAERVETLIFDATRVEDHAALVDRAFALVEGIDLVLLAAGDLGDQILDETDPVRAAKVLTVNFSGLAPVLLAAASHLRRQGQGRIVVLSSVAGIRPRRANFIYGSAKSGLDAFAQGLADSLVGSGVVVQVIRPGFVHTKMTEGLKAAPFATTPDEVGDAVLAALSTDHSIVYVPRVLRLVFLVLARLPRVLWRRVPG